KLEQIVKERNEQWRMAFMVRMSQYSPKEIGFLDKTSKDKCTPGCLHGHAPKGQCATSCQVVVHGQHVSTLGLMTIDGMVTSSFFSLQWCIIDSNCCECPNMPQLPMCSPYPGPLSVLVMDNATIHHGEGVAELIEAYGKLL
ncbi:uncharacterized protein BJ212DRAFT_1263066, partial [Suillus subaureus]